jgi:YqaJ-like viral recombinase domain
MSIEIFNCIQGTPEWFACRKGIPTASEFKRLMVTKGKGPGGVSLTRIEYLEKLAAEIITGKPAGEGYTNADMERGKEQEPDARAEYGFRQNVEVVQVGFVRNAILRCGASPDCLVGDDGGAEIKAVLPHIQIKRKREGEMPAEHVAQVQGNILTCERDWWDFVSYCPDLACIHLDLFMIRVYRDDKYIAGLIEQLARFNEELDALVEKLRRGAPVEIAA